MPSYTLNFRRHFVDEQFATVNVKAKNLAEALANANAALDQANPVWIHKTIEPTQTRVCVHTVYHGNTPIATLGKHASTLNGECLADGWVG